MTDLQVTKAPAATVRATITPAVTYDHYYGSLDPINVDLNQAKILRKAGNDPKVISQRIEDDKTWMNYQSDKRENKVLLGTIAAGTIGGAAYGTAAVPGFGTIAGGTLGFLGGAFAGLFTRAGESIYEHNKVNKAMEQEAVKLRQNPNACSVFEASQNICH